MSLHAVRQAKNRDVLVTRHGQFASESLNLPFQKPLKDRFSGDGKHCRATMSQRQEKSDAGPIPGAFPEHGEFPASYWARVFTVDEKQISQSVTKLKIPFRKYFGRERWIDAKDIRKAFPQMTASDEPEQRGGSRKRD